jgi:hypothetical protein
MHIAPGFLTLISSIKALTYISHIFTFLSEFLKLLSIHLLKLSYGTGELLLEITIKPDSDWIQRCN